MADQRTALPSDFNVCHAGNPCAPMQQHAETLRRLDELLRRCREDSHTPTYADLMEVRRHG